MSDLQATAPPSSSPPAGILSWLLGERADCQTPACFPRERVVTQALFPLPSQPWPAPRAIPVRWERNMIGEKATSHHVG